MTHEEVEANLARTLEVLATLGVSVSPWWRPPHGQCTPDTVRVAAAYGVTLAGWDYDAGDYVGGCVSHSRFRGVVLLHDGHAGQGRDARRQTSDNTIQALRRLRAGVVPMVPTTNGLRWRGV